MGAPSPFPQTLGHVCLWLWHRVDLGINCLKDVKAEASQELGIKLFDVVKSSRRSAPGLHVTQRLPNVTCLEGRPNSFTFRFRKLKGLFMCWVINVLLSHRGKPVQCSRNVEGPPNCDMSCSLLTVLYFTLLYAICSLQFHLSMKLLMWKL